jgi:uncharacterized protein
MPTTTTRQRGTGLTPLRSLALTIATLVGTGLGVGLYATLIEPRWYRLRRDTLSGTLRQDPGRPVRVLVVADIHHDPPHPDLERFFDRLAGETYDLVIAAGDLLGAHGAEQPTVELLGRLTAGGRPGIAVLGSNDLFAPRAKSPHRYFTAFERERRIRGVRLETDVLRTGLAERGWSVLEDQRQVVETAAGAVEVAGLRDPHLPYVALPPADQVAPVEDAAVARIGVVHAPYSRPLDLLADLGYRTLICGHTHGGQVRIPLVGALVTNSDLSTDRARGTSRWGDAWLHVSAGLGQSSYAPFRFACRPEASLLTLTA